MTDPTPLAIRIAAALDLLPSPTDSRETCFQQIRYRWDGLGHLRLIDWGTDVSLHTRTATVVLNMQHEPMASLILHDGIEPLVVDREVFNHADRAVDGYITYALEQAGETAFLEWLRGGE